ncbi:MAG: alpha/beta fold hydrolase [Thermoflexales bacterium]|nr:alpha/beta fold hydrolase [Thermoflexales bacterium]MDW8352216.1 alpha/beta fold hydrolase [Anaerolineae bacterium]
MRLIGVGAVLLMVMFGGLPARAQPSVGNAPYESLTIEHLRQRSYGAGEFKVERTLQVTSAFTRSLISFASDGLTVYGFMNTPKGSGPFPVVIVLHGYVNPRTYRTPTTYTQRYADALARAGFLVIHPDYRGHGRSEGEAEGNTNLFRTGYAIDVLNLIAHAGRLPNTVPGAIGLFGHSMGGGIALRVAVVNPDVKAVVLYGSMSGDERLNVDRIKRVFRGVSYMPEDDVPLDLWDDISPISYLSDLRAAVEMHHGARDPQVPLAWSRDLHARLSALGKPAALYEYTGAGHILRGRDYTAMMERVTRFFGAHLR